MRRTGGAILALVCMVLPLQAELRNTMPDSHLERFKQEANRKAARFPQSYILEEKTVQMRLYLTFDDGPDRVNTPKILDILKKEGVKATFFFLGERIEAAPGILRRAAREGHVILPHGNRHVDFRKHPFETVLAQQIRPVAETIEGLTQQHYPLAFRPPYGAVTDKQIEAFAKAGYRIINWSVDSFDWMKGRSSEQIVAEVMRYLHPGAIILLHSGGANRQTPRALGVLIPRLKKAGYRFDTLH